MSWPDVSADDPFGPHTLPYGVLDIDGERECAVRIGHRALPLRRTALELAPELLPVFGTGNLDALLAAGPPFWDAARSAVTSWLTEPRCRAAVEPLLVQLDAYPAVLPWAVADYVDFYASEQHAANVGRIFRPGTDPLPANWKHLPVGYHGRAGTVIASGSPVRRPAGQYRVVEGDDRVVRFGPTRQLDFEAEVGFVVGAGSAIGSPVAVGDFARHVFGVVLLNDWSARDIQSWEYVPLGPFLAKSFATTVSAWITPLAALRQARIPRILQSPPPLPYLDDHGDSWALDLTLEVRINGRLVSRPPFRQMYWTPAQMLAHLTVNGASTRPGDLFGSGTVSGAQPDQRGSLLELSWGGTEPLDIGGERRSFLHDGDEVVITATAPGPNGTSVGLAEVRGRVTA